MGIHWLFQQHKNNMAAIGPLGKLPVPGGIGVPPVLLGVAPKSRLSTIARKPFLPLTTSPGFPRPSGVFCGHENFGSV
jgi:hypothetical protein